MAKRKTTLELALLGGAIAATVYAAAPLVLASRQAADAVNPAASAARRPAAAPENPAAAAAPPPAAVPVQPRLDGATGGAAFATLSWLPPPPPPVVAVAAPPPAPVAPSAPPLPYTFVGLLETDGQQPTAFVARGDTLLMVAAGDTLEDKTYRVDSLSADKLVLTYLPLGIAQTLLITGPTP